jgi:WhiB family transcriptional regulator, redox-sensing transcriptional regulator
MSFEHVDFGRPARLHDRGWGARGSTPHTNTGPPATGTIRRSHLSLVSDGFDLAPVTHDEQWQERALCAQTDPEAFFPEKGGSTREAKRICMGCEVRDACLEYALAHDERFGIWGGLSERERRRLKRGIS